MTTTGRDAHEQTGAGAMPEETEAAAAQAAEEAAAAEAAAAEAAQDAALGDAGRRALESEREARKRFEREAKATKAELDKIRAQNQSEQEKAIEAAREAAKGEVMSEANKRVLRSEIKAVAAGRMAPALAVKLLDLDDFEVDDNGDVDEKAISKAIDQLIKETPGLALNGSGKRTTGGADGGARGGAAGGPTMNDAIRTRMGR